LGIDGLSGAGKTTYANEITVRLKERFSVVVFHIDDHLRLRKDRYNTGHPPWYEYYYLQWDVRLLQKRLFKPLKKGACELVLPFYRDEEDFLEDKMVHLPKNSLIIIEGVFLQRIEWRGFFDFLIYLDCSREERYRRVLERTRFAGDERERIKKYETRYWPAEEYYENRIQPQRKADWVVKTELPHE